MEDMDVVSEACMDALDVGDGECAALELIEPRELCAMALEDVRAEILLVVDGSAGLAAEHDAPWQIVLFAVEIDDAARGVYGGVGAAGAVCDACGAVCRGRELVVFVAWWDEKVKLAVAAEELAVELLAVARAAVFEERQGARERVDGARLGVAVRRRDDKVDADVVAGELGVEARKGAFEDAHEFLFCFWAVVAEIDADDAPLSRDVFAALDVLFKRARVDFERRCRRWGLGQVEARLHELEDCVEVVRHGGDGVADDADDWVAARIPGDAAVRELCNAVVAHIHELHGRREDELLWDFGDAVHLEDESAQCLHVCNVARDLRYAALAEVDVDERVAGVDGARDVFERVALSEEGDEAVWEGLGQG
eukprot:comp21862_c0_seq1/m.49467 comp21862_c0_seq1/g.49467  ORF comp21862_c0_seq1/g.49467 comp21862_c0_seq1/m.49467 type:complete len:367 (-) comp21862_c0_seq1:375-1475(-)